MTTIISPDQYCDNPAEYKNNPTITDQTRRYWDHYCQIRNELNNGDMPTNDDLRQLTSGVIEQLIMGIFSPQGIEMLGVILGLKVTYRSAKLAIAKMLKSGLSEDVIKTAEEFIAKGGDAMIGNAGGVIFGLGKDLAFIDIEVAKEIGYSGGKYAVSALFKGLDMVVDFADWAMMVLMVISMIFDAWDPCKLDVMLDAEQLANFSEIFNDQFRNAILQNLDATTDSYGTTVLSAIWPIEYFAEESALLPLKTDYYNKIEQNLVYTYLNSLNFNSCGNPIKRTKGGKAISNNVITGMNASSFIFLSDNNTVVSNWLLKWWPVLLGILLLLLFIFFHMRNKNTKK